MIFALHTKKLVAVLATFSFSEKLGPSIATVPSGLRTSPTDAACTRLASSLSTPDMSLSDLETLAMALLLATFWPGTVKSQKTSHIGGVFQLLARDLIFKPSASLRAKRLANGTGFHHRRCEFSWR